MQLPVKKIALLSLLTATLTLSVSTAALAATNLGNVDSLSTFGALTSGRSFDDLYNFAVNPNSGAVISASTFTFGTRGTTITAMDLYVGTFVAAARLVGHTALPTTIVRSQSGGSLFTALTRTEDYGTLSPGEYTLRVAGSSSSALSMPYTGYIALSPALPVPEPETFAMVLAGLGMMATIIRRRKIR